MLPIALSSENARAPQGLPHAQGGLQPDGTRRIPDVLLTLHQPAVSACGRGRPRTQDARGSIMLPIALSSENAIAPPGIPRAQGGLQPARAASCARAGGLRLDFVSLHAEQDAHRSSLRSGLRLD
jgi:hypothetical protein